MYIHNYNTVYKARGAEKRGIPLLDLMLCPLLLPALLALWMVFMPRSPQFLVSKGDMAAGRKSLQWLRGRQEVEEELAAITADLQQAEQIGTVRILRGKQH